MKKAGVRAILASILYLRLRIIGTKNFLSLSALATAKSALDQISIYLFFILYIKALGRMMDGILICRNR